MFETDPAWPIAIAVHVLGNLIVAAAVTARWLFDHWDRWQMRRVEA